MSSQKKKHAVKKKRLHNKKCHVVIVNQNQKNTEKKIFMKKEQSFKKKFNRSLSDGLLTINDKRSFKESIKNRNNNSIVSINQDKKIRKSDPFLIEHNSSKKRHRNLTDYLVMTEDKRSEDNAISKIKNDRILKRSQKSLQQIPKYPVESLDHLNRNLIFGQQLKYDFLSWENNNSQMKQHDNIKIENEKTLRKSLSHRLAKQDEFYSNDFCSLVSPVYDLPSESDFCEGSLESKCGELFMKNMLKDIENTNSVGSNLSQDIISNDGSPKECIKNDIIEIISTNNNSIRENENIFSSHPSFKNSIDDRNNLIKHDDASIIKEQIVSVENEEQNIHGEKNKYRCLSASSRKLISNFDETEKFSSNFLEKQLIKKSCIQNIDEELSLQKSGLLNIDASYKHFIRNECDSE